MATEAAAPISFRMDAETKERVRALAEQGGVSFSEVIQTAIKEFLAEQKAVSYLVAYTTGDEIENIELPAGSSVSSPLELTLSIKRALREQEGESSNPDHCEPISIWEFEKSNDSGGTYLVLTQSADSRGAMSYVPLMIVSAEPITNFEQLSVLAEAAANKGMVMIMAITSVCKLKT